MKGHEIPTRIPFFCPFSGKIDLIPEVKNDKKGNLHIQLWCDDGPYMTLTKNLDKKCDPDCSYIDHLATGESISGWLCAQGIGTRTGHIAYSGFCTYEEIQFNPEFLDCYKNKKEWKNPEWIWCTAYRDTILGGYPLEREDLNREEDNLIAVAVKKDWLIFNLGEVFDMESITIPEKMEYLGDILDETGQEFMTADTETKVVQLAIKDQNSGVFVCKEFFLTKEEREAADRINFQGHPGLITKDKPRSKNRR